MATNIIPPAPEPDLGELRATIAEMGGLAEAAIDGALQALVNRDIDAAERIVVQDVRIDAIEAGLEQRVLHLIGLPTARPDDLREALAALKIGGVIERIGDYAKNIAKRVALLDDVRDIAPMAILPAIARATVELVHDALDAFAARDPAAARSVCANDRTIDDLYNSLFRALLAHMAAHPETIGAATHLLFVAKNLERIGDHATNIAEMVYFAATATRMDERVRGVDALAPPG